MTASHKKIILLQAKEQRLAFNIQSLDTVKYTQRNFKQEVKSEIESILMPPEKPKRQEADLVPKRLQMYLGLKGINWPQIAEHSDFEYALTLGADLGFLLLVDFAIFAYCYLKPIKNDQVEDEILLYLRTLFNRAALLLTNIERQIRDLENWTSPSETASDVSGVATFSLVARPSPEDVKRLNYLNFLRDTIDDTRFYLYRNTL